MPGDRFVFGPFAFDAMRGTLTRAGEMLALGQKGAKLLEALVRAPGQVLAKSTLMDAAWPGMAVEDSNLSVQIAALRKLLGGTADAGEWIATVQRLGYRFVGAVERESEAAPGQAPARPSIAVLPLADLGAAHELEYLADGLAEDIIIALTRFRWFSVAARDSSFAYKGKTIGARQVAQELGVRYLIAGSVRKSDHRLRVAVELIDADTGHHLWAERYDRELTEVLALQDEIALRIAGAIEPELLKSESLAAPRRSGSATAWDLVRRGTWHFHKVARESHWRARDLFREACRLDPDLTEAQIWRARVCAGIAAYGWSDDRAATLREGLDAAIRAIHLDEKNPYSHYAHAIVSAYVEPERTVAAAERAIELSPSFALGHLVLGMGQLFRGDAPAGAAALAHGLALNRHDPQNFVWYDLLAIAQLLCDDADAAVRSAGESVKIRPSWRPAFATLAACYAAAARPAEANAAFRQMQELPEADSGVLLPQMKRSPQWQERIAALLRSAEAGASAAWVTPRDKRAPP
jgi:TolB-like protein